jgi:hypothetical protein
MNMQIYVVHDSAVILHIFRMNILKVDLDVSVNEIRARVMSINYRSVIIIIIIIIIIIDLNYSERLPIAIS